ncbi:hypothetical protein BaRGS_00012548 [Batillaria attramentaria]|uniref:Uncharacterized protein n=1 Tax=Batillaria attramentaria TaxID=370345 RepID=A0ABD0LAA3_9CAEN
MPVDLNRTLGSQVTSVNTTTPMANDSGSNSYTKISWDAGNYNANVRHSPGEAANPYVKTSCDANKRKKNVILTSRSHGTPVSTTANTRHADR